MRIVLLTLALKLVTLVDAKMQSITVKGITLCKKKPMSGVIVELWERDLLTPNDLLRRVKSGVHGEFSVSGHENEIGTIEPFLKFIHICNVKKPSCKRVTEYSVPKSKINGVYNMTYVALDIFTAKDKLKCRR
ncbi:hypothetical protein GCK32_020750 [Trichostrongylus colubriformis]|uniref:Transthyretin-like family protein n=1 Tax=Trichostrongylus colubriformis TaxID=6319 RepID=A0AAN8IV59_TRICO